MGTKRMTVVPRSQKKKATDKTKADDEAREREDRLNTATWTGRPTKSGLKVERKL